MTSTSTSTSTAAALVDQARRQETAVNQRETAYMRTLAGIIAATVRDEYPTAAGVLMRPEYDDDGDENMRLVAVVDAAGASLWDVTEDDLPDALCTMEGLYVSRLNLYGPTEAGWASSCDLAEGDLTRRGDTLWRLRLDDAIAAAATPTTTTDAADAIAADRDVLALVLDVAARVLGSLDAEDAREDYGVTPEVAEQAYGAVTAAERLLVGIPAAAQGRPVAEYVAGHYDDDEGQVDAHLVCSKCGPGTSFYEVDTAVRWTPVEADGDGLAVHYDGGADFQSDHLRCAACGTEHDYPAEWNADGVVRF